MESCLNDSYPNWKIQYEQWDMRTNFLKTGYIKEVGGNVQEDLEKRLSDQKS